MKEVFVVSDNVFTSLGRTTRQNFEEALAGKDGIKFQQQTDLFPAPFWASLLPRNEIDSSFSGEPVNYTHFEKICIQSIEEASSKAQIDLTDKKTLLILSTTKGNVELLHNNQFNEARVYLHESARIIQKYFQLKHFPLVVSNACISGVVALNCASDMLQGNKYENIIVCGADVVSEFTISGFESFKALSDGPCKPFDANRNGTSLGEAAATVILSTKHTSKLKLLSGSSSNDANHISGPSRNGHGLYVAIQKTLTKNKNPKIDFISAHGTGTIFNDEMESKAFNLAGLQHVPLNSYKGLFGHTFGAAGVLEAAMTLESMRSNTLIPSKGFHAQSDAVQLMLITEAKSAELNTCLKTASGFGGCNAAVLFEKNKLSAMKNSIVSYCRIKNNQIILNGELVFSAPNANFTDFSKQVYQELKFSYLKYFKMDNLSKLAFMASEVLLNGIKTNILLKPEEIAVYISNAGSSIDTDRKHNESIQNRLNYFPSPSVFVYTLANIMVGEICIKNNFQGENAFFIQPEFDAHFMADYTNQKIENGACKAALTGWVEYDNNKADALLCWIEKSNQENNLEFNAENFYKLYQNNLN